MKTLAQILEQAELAANEQSGDTPPITVTAETSVAGADGDSSPRQPTDHGPADHSPNHQAGADGDSAWGELSDMQPTETGLTADVAATNVLAAKLAGAKVPRRVDQAPAPLPHSGQECRQEAEIVAAGESPAMPNDGRLRSESHSASPREAERTEGPADDVCSPLEARGNCGTDAPRGTPKSSGGAAEQSAPMSPKRDAVTWQIAAAGPPTAWEAPGGGEVQLSATMDALRRRGVDARPWRPWEESLAHFDCLHLFGSVREHLLLIEAARRQGVAVALSPVAWFDWRNCLRQPGSFWARWSAAARFGLRAAWPRVHSWRRRLYHAVDVLLPNSHAEAEQLARYFGVPMNRIHVTPNGAEPRLADADPGPFRKLVGLSQFVLCPGRIEPRKNQLGLIEAMQGTGVTLVLLGDAVPGHEDYLAACRRTGGDEVIHVPRVDHDDPMLASAYAAAGCLALCSWFETPGLAALEAALTGCPLVLPRAGSAEEYFGELAAYVEPDDRDGIRDAVIDALAGGRSELLASHVRHYLTWDTTAEITVEAYAKAIDGNHSSPCPASTAR